MKASDVLIKPILSEKANKQTEKLNRYSFVVDKKANKLEIKKAIETFYGVQVENVNTIVVPSKAKSKYTKAGYIVGRKPSKKKAIVTIAKGESIDLYSSGV
ncbi:MAG: 50S ribosomal protein L23 [Chitinophagaceae bacterium]|jgi:large subunit ribosomal protein L23|nr:50S ribosomal protein L23 [Chitinophagaceae bacterium]